jgi:hypothetical protein
LGVIFFCCSLPHVSALYPHFLRNYITILEEFLSFFLCKMQPLLNKYIQKRKSNNIKTQFQQQEKNLEKIKVLIVFNLVYLDFSVF